MAYYCMICGAPAPCATHVMEGAMDNPPVLCVMVPGDILGIRLHLASNTHQELLPLGAIICRPDEVLEIVVRRVKLAE